MSDENKNLEDALNNGEDIVKDAAEEVIENGTEAVREAAEASAEAIKKASGLFGSAVEDSLMGNQSAEKDEEQDTGAEGSLFGSNVQNELASTGSNTKMYGTIAAIIGAVILIAVIAVAVFFKQYSPVVFNKYNRQGYINTTGRTIGEVADLMGMSMEEFLQKYGLPDDMPANTEESSAYYTMPVGKVAEEMFNMDYDMFCEEFGLGDNVTPDMKWGDAEATIRIGSYVGEENFESFKEAYDLGDDVTADTLWGEVRNIVDQKTKDENDAREKAREEAARAAEEESKAAEEEADTSADAAPADSAAQQ